jgi:hypothetical protein
MFVRNATPFPAALPRGELADGIHVAALVATIAYRWTARGVEPWEGERAPLPSDPPSVADRPLWKGTSVTAAGAVHGPGHRSVPARVELRVGSFTKTLLVHGDRRWVKNAGKLVPSAAAPYDELPLSWELAFGGHVELPPGPFGPRKLPHPGGRFAHPHNPVGRGFCVDERNAEGALLPNIELDTQPMRCPTDQPFPGGIAPCPHLPGLRALVDFHDQGGERWAGTIHAALHLAHPAAVNQIFGPLPVGAPVRLAGLSAAPIERTLPDCPFRVSVRRGRSTTQIEATIRQVHLSAADGAMLVTYAAPFAYERPPSWVNVRPADGAAPGE